MSNKLAFLYLPSLPWLLKNLHRRNLLTLQDTINSDILQWICSTWNWKTLWLNTLCYFFYAIICAPYWVNWTWSWYLFIIWYFLWTWLILFRWCVFLLFSLRITILWYDLITFHSLLFFYLLIRFFSSNI